MPPRKPPPPSAHAAAEAASQRRALPSAHPGIRLRIRRPSASRRRSPDGPPFRRHRRSAVTRMPAHSASPVTAHPASTHPRHREPVRPCSRPSPGCPSRRVTWRCPHPCPAPYRRATWPLPRRAGRADGRHRRSLAPARLALPATATCRSSRPGRVMRTDSVIRGLPRVAAGRERRRPTDLALPGPIGSPIWLELPR